MLSILSVLVCYLVSLSVYRLYVHPLSKFPGPRIAALTQWYEFYYDVFLQGSYTNRIRDMHAKYGPIVRISPFELHINDPHFYSTLYSPAPNPSRPLAHRRHKWLYFVRFSGVDNTSVFGTTDHDVHRMRRKALEPFFSPANVKRLGQMLKHHVTRLCERLEDEGAKGDPVRIKLGFACLATDVITEYAMGKSYDTVEYPNFFPDWSDTLASVGLAGYFLKSFYWLFPLSEMIPIWMAKRLSPGFGWLLELKAKSRRQILEIMAEHKNYETKNIKEGEQPTIFHEMLRNPNLPPQEKTMTRLESDAQTLVGAGTETTGATLAVIVVYVLADPEIHKKLKVELLKVMPDRTKIPDLQVLEKLTYLVRFQIVCISLTMLIFSRLRSSEKVSVSATVSAKGSKESQTSTSNSANGPFLLALQRGCLQR